MRGEKERKEEGGRGRRKEGKIREDLGKRVGGRMRGSEVSSGRGGGGRKGGSPPDMEGFGSNNLSQLFCGGGGVINFGIKGENVWCFVVFLFAAATLGSAYGGS